METQCQPLNRHEGSKTVQRNVHTSISAASMGQPMLNELEIVGLTVTTMIRRESLGR